jgi:hypothetical protein
MHNYHNPTCVRDAQNWVLNQFPKRCCGQLVGRDEAPSLGWGIHFQEGWHRDKIWNIGFVFFGLGILIFGVLWGVLKRDVQSAFAIAGYWITALAVILEYMAHVD